MTSKNPLIALRMEPELFERVKQAAELDGRTLSNYVAHRLRVLHPATPSSTRPLTTRPPDRQIHLEDAIAAIVERGPMQTPKRRATVARIAARKRVTARARPK